MKIKKIIIGFLICILPSLAFAGKAYYVDCSQSDPLEDGSYTHPWNSVKDVNRHRFSTGDDVYFKVNTTCDPNESLSIDWDGESTDQAIIGAYSGENNFGLNGNARPIIDGNWTLPGDTNGLVRYTNGSGYVTIKDLHVRNADGSGISIIYLYTPERYHTDYNTVENCFVQNVTRQGIMIARGSYNKVENNIVERASYNYPDAVGIDIVGMSMEDTTLHNIVRGNTVYWSAEGIGVYKGARYTIVERNSVYDGTKYHIYVANARDNIVRYNLVYENDGGLDGRPDYMVGTDCEGHVPGVIKVTGNNEFYGNMIAGGSRGIFLINNCNTIGVEQNGNKIYNNTVVNSNTNFYFAGVDSTWSNNTIKNNISWTITEGSVHSNTYSPSGVTWSHNNFDEPVSGNAANNARIYEPELNKKSGWDSLAAGTVNGTEFALTDDCYNVGGGTPIDGYNHRIYHADYASDDEIKVETTFTNFPDIGAWTVLDVAQKPILTLRSPNGFKIVATK